MRSSRFYPRGESLAVFYCGSRRKFMIKRVYKRPASPISNGRCMGAIVRTVNDLFTIIMGEGCAGARAGGATGLKLERFFI